MNKTAMQELIENFEAINKDGYNIEPKAAIELCKQLLHKEKEQIKDAYVNGKRVVAANSVARFVPKKNDDPEVYYNNTFTTDSNHTKTYNQ